MISIDDLKALFTPAGPSSLKSLSGGDSQSFCRGSSWRFPGGFWSFARNRVLVCPSCFLACVLAFLFYANSVFYCTFVL
ncbi:hypothetical protein Hanom_Chr16g01459831 [Helianthus anomalus]